MTTSGVVDFEREAAGYFVATCKIIKGDVIIDLIFAIRVLVDLDLTVKTYTLASSVDTFHPTRRFPGGNAPISTITLDNLKFGRK